MAKHPEMMKLQVVIPPFVAERMAKIPKNSRSVVVTYALNKLFASRDPQDIGFLGMLAHGSGSHPQTHTPPFNRGTSEPASRIKETPPLPEGKGDRKLPDTKVSGDRSSASAGLVPLLKGVADLDARDIAGGLMDDD
jgi:hypothetical protein